MMPKITSKTTSKPEAEASTDSAVTTIASSSSCPCGSGQSYTDCCEPYHLEKRLPPTPEALMRARFTAFAQGKVAFIMNTVDRKHPDFRKSANLWKLELLKYCETTRFLTLTILSASNQSADWNDQQDLGWVEFEVLMQDKASNPAKCKPYILYEKSVFTRKNQRWLYTSGDCKTKPAPEIAASPAPEETTAAAAAPQNA
jgi:SEC-C motif domain protein